MYSIALGVYGCIKPFISISQNWCWRTWLSGAQDYSPLRELAVDQGKPLGAVLGNGDMIRIGSKSHVEGYLVGGGGC